MTSTSNRRHLPAALCLSAVLIGMAPFASAALTAPAGALRTAETAEPMGTAAVAVGPWIDGASQVIEAEGAVTRTAWRIDPGPASTAELIAPLRNDLVGEGYEVLFECDTDRCGGFDFRYGLDILAEPEMHVDLGDFRYLAASKGKDYVTIVASRSARSGFVQVTRIDPSGVPPGVALSTKSPGGLEPMPEAAPSAAASGAAPGVAVPPQAGGPDASVEPGAIALRIEADGAVPLDDLMFESGSARLGAGPYASLQALADYLKADPARRVTLVGHTDATGQLAANMALSKKRAAAVLERLVAEYAVSPGQLAAEGAGFLAPRASNLSEDGRRRNRRVEAMLASTL